MRNLMVAVVGGLLLIGASQAFANEDWKIHSKWCAENKGSSGSIYRSTCQKYDQFDSVVACQKDPGNSGLASVQAAGRTAVNSYMDSYKPKECL